MLMILKRIIFRGLSVRDVEKILKTNKKTMKIRDVEKKKIKKDPMISSYENSLKDILCTKVGINIKGDGGVIEIFFLTEDDFNRIYNQLIKSN